MTDKQMTEMTASPGERERSPAKPPSRFRIGKRLAVIAAVLVLAVTVVTPTTCFTRSSQAEIAILQEQLQQNQLLKEQAQVDAEGR